MTLYVNKRTQESSTKVPNTSFKSVTNYSNKSELGSQRTSERVKLGEFSSESFVFTSPIWKPRE